MIYILFCTVLSVLEPLAANALDGLYTSIKPYTGSITNTYSTYTNGGFLGVGVTTTYYVETPYSNFVTTIESPWIETYTSTYQTKEGYYIGTDNIGTHATIYFVVTPQTNLIIETTTYGYNTKIETISTNYNINSSSINLDKNGQVAFSLSSEISSTLTTYYIATPLSTIFTTVIYSENVHNPYDASSSATIVSSSGTHYVYETVYYVVPLGSLVVESVKPYSGEITTTYSTSFSTGTDKEIYTVYYINTPYPESKITGYNYWANTYSSLSTGSTLITTDSLGKTVEMDYYVVYESTPSSQITSFTYWTGTSNNTYLTEYNKNSQLIFSVDLFNILFFWDWFKEVTYTYTTYFVKTPYKTKVISSVDSFLTGTVASTYKTKTTTFFGLDNNPTVETVYFVATPVSSGNSIVYSYWAGNDQVTQSTYTSSGITVAVVLQPYSTTTLHQVTTNVPSIDSITTYSTQYTVININNVFYQATILDINIPLVTTTYSEYIYNGNIADISTTTKTSNFTVTTPIGVFDDQTTDIINNYTMTTFLYYFPKVLKSTASDIVGLYETTYSTFNEVVIYNSSTYTISVELIATPVPTTYSTTVFIGNSVIEEVVDYYYTTSNGTEIMTVTEHSIIASPTTFTTDVISGSSTYEEEVSYYYTTTSNCESVLTSMSIHMSPAPTTFTTAVVEGS
ncbi:uncharacterized protein HGUI_03607 [Hanseniaspora guilliermondii]|uniref:Uncharacterized protein n=1 Tax=Hanseniaspora guilliermondii TaxID=56406 RepID=A0A1L0FPA9_9ASCO|nr:uncharacterized protein HGUI_03607 [Hanseniaspora guilliermondii]